MPHVDAESFDQSVRVDCFTSYNPMTVGKWPLALAANDVLVMTAQSLLNMLEAGKVQFNQMQLLVRLHTLHDCNASCGKMSSLQALLVRVSDPCMNWKALGSLQAI